MRGARKKLLVAAAISTAAVPCAGCGTKDGFAVSACTQSRVWKTGYDSGPAQALPSTSPSVSIVADGLNGLYSTVSNSFSSSADHGLSWATLGTYVYPGTSVTVSPGSPQFTGSRTLLALASPTISSVQHYLVLQSTDQGASWQSLFDTTSATFGSGGPYYVSQQAGGGPILVFGSGTLNAAQSAILSRSSNGGASWTGVENFQLTSGKATSGVGILYARSGKILAVYNSENTTGVVRVSADGGSSWSTSEKFSPTTGNASQPVDAAITPQDTAVVGYGSSSQNNAQWIVRGSSDEGSTWSQLDNYSYDSNQNTSLLDVGSDGFGNLWATGIGQDSTGKTHFIIRTSTDQGKSWTTVDDSTLLSSTNLTQAAARLAISPAGAVNVLLEHIDTTSSPKQARAEIRYIDCF